MSPRAKAAANAILVFAASLLNLVYGLALIALTVFGLYAAFYAVLFEEAPPLLANPGLQAFVVFGVAFALLQHWVGNSLASAALKGAKPRDALREMIEAERART